MLEWGTSATLAAAMYAGAHAWIEGCAIPLPETITESDDDVGCLIQQAYMEQSELGWDNFFRGFWTSSWRAAQDAHWKKVGKGGSFETGESWSGKAQAWFFDFFEYIWGIRNAAEHGEDLQVQRQIRLTKCERTIRRLYARGQDLPDGENHPFRESLESLLERTVSDQELWIAKTVPFLRLAFRQAKHRKKAKQRAITEFFHLVRGALPGSAVFDQE
jgi:hypothetical protein